MTIDQFYLLVSGFLGVLFHCLLKYKSLKTDADKANLRFNFKTYVVQDAPAIAMSFLSVLIWYFVFKEVAAKYSNIHDFARISFVTMGAIGSYVIQNFLSRAKAQIRKTTDEKTNIADYGTKNPKPDPGPTDNSILDK